MTSRLISFKLNNQRCNVFIQLLPLSLNQVSSFISIHWYHEGYFRRFRAPCVYKTLFHHVVVGFFFGYQVSLSSHGLLWASGKNVVTCAMDVLGNLQVIGVHRNMHASTVWRDGGDMTTFSHIAFIIPAAGETVILSVLSRLLSRPDVRRRDWQSGLISDDSNKRDFSSRSQPCCVFQEKQWPDKLTSPPLSK